jgi:uncharacterized protein
LVSAPEFAPGTPSWVDLGSPDIPATTAFYCDIFGWDALTLPESGGYTIFTLGGQPVAATGPQTGQASAWTTYIATDNVDDTAAKVLEAGGKVVVEPMDAMDAGRLAVFTDAQGAVFSGWQPRSHKGAGLVNEPGSFGWNELSTRDMDGAKRFYNHVFGWTAKESEVPDYGTYTEWQLDGRTIGGGMQMGEAFPPDLPPYWLVYFVVSDTDAVVQRVQELGGSVLMPATDMSEGRMAALRDPHGAVFSVIQLPG